MELQPKTFYRDTWAEIDLEALKDNVVNIRNILPEKTNLIVAVKANGYGHGAIEAANAAMRAGAYGLAVAFLDEALALRNSGIQAPILIMGATSPEDAHIAVKHHLSLTVFDLNWLKHAEKFIPKSDKLQIHIKCDTGMGRIGIRKEEELRQMEKFIEQSASFIFEGIFTHFATADQLDDEYYLQQLTLFKQFLKCLNNLPPFIHAANSAATLFHDDSIFNTARAGIAMYGLSPSEEMKPYFPFARKEVFSLHTKIIHVKKIAAGERVSYGGSHIAEKDEWIATLPIGYADGWIRKLSGQKVIAGEELATIVGRICMDQTMIKLPTYMPIGTKVTLIGKQGNHFIPVDEIAKKLNTINYEVTCSISSRVPRVYKEK